jgi:hypothetical protein
MVSFYIVKTDALITDFVYCEGPKFQKLNLQLRKEIQQLQQKGYYGPGLFISYQSK